eukprot:CAMPEP_0183373184 /NCGR_PEP_ID=MMETSP0164_2-20130417/110729_1 /TAXON_ID=221442 /ORGANISM="Coccolithus pelagicus ssp braarudi, Strain PLY182g" /LENGTH=150 /DNA_ID=CAMNT_0025550023 /DNA_START=50 /DNA_END=498 /DNA_ORIENTATION=-
MQREVDSDLEEELRAACLRVCVVPIVVHGDSGPHIEGSARDDENTALCFEPDMSEANMEIITRVDDPYDPWLPHATVRGALRRTLAPRTISDLCNLLHVSWGQASPPSEWASASRRLLRRSDAKRRAADRASLCEELLGLLELGLQPSPL